ncbi:MAG: isoprenylcysteine carboxylmethyltransferase family protein [Candidatus Omnitrophica bacterium]|nr:isoprenylcysteine carboxylmethyltransferase family protein [Candidatus Omnitrophota bacterium]
MKGRIKINAIFIAFSLIIVAILPSLFLRNKQSFLDELLEIVGLVFILLGQILRVSARGYKAENSENGTRLVTGGPYALVRHPMYLGIILIGLGVVLMVCHIWIFLLFLGIFILRYAFLFRREETYLIQKFGQKYLTYQRQTPLLIPQRSFLFNKNLPKYLPLRWRWFKSETLSIVAVLMLVLFIEFTEDYMYANTLFNIQEGFIFIALLIFYLVFLAWLTKKYEAISGDSQNS